MLILLSLCFSILIQWVSPDCTPVVEHPVIWSMTRLNGSNETAVLNLLYSLKSSPEAYSLATGRLLKRVQGVYTHALMSRHLSRTDLKNYYDLRVHGHVDLMKPFIEEELVVDYEDCVEDLSVGKSDDVVFHITYMTVKRGVSSSGLEDTLELVKSLQSVMPSIVLQVTAGKNNMMKRHKIERYTHAFVAYLRSEEAVNELYSHPFFLLVMDKVYEICELVISVDFAPYLPKQSSATI